MIFERLIPKDHLLVLINSIIDFSFVYDMVKDKYSDIGRKSEDPVMMLKICLLEFLYTLSDKKLICDAFRKVIREMRKFNEPFAEQQLVQFENEIEEEYKKDDKVSVKRYLKIAQKYAEYLYLKTYDELQMNKEYKEAFGILWDIIEQYTNGKKDKIVSVVDPDAKIAHKSRGNIKRGYKDHIIVDEDSEIILASVQTPFNVGDEKKLKEQ